MTPKENYKKHTMKKLIVATLLLGSGTLLSAQKTAKIPAYYKPAKSEMYHKGWIYNPQIEMFARFKMKSSFHKTKRII